MTNKNIPDDMFADNEFRDFDVDAARGTLDELFLLARHYQKSTKFKELLEFVTKFKRYSSFNAMLVYIQMPGAQYVLPAKRWWKEYKRTPKEGAQPLVMLQPMSPVMFGFDVSQTEGKPLPTGFENPFETQGYINHEEFHTTIINAQRDGVDLIMRPLGSNLGGYVRNASSPYHSIGIGLVKSNQNLLKVDGQDLPVLAEITLNSNLPDETNYATLTHELGHLYCGHIGSPNLKQWPDRRYLGRNSMEFEAEAVSYLVCQRAGIETPAVEYLHGYLDENFEVPKSISIETICRAAHRIERMRTIKVKISDYLLNKKEFNDSL